MGLSRIFSNTTAQKPTIPRSAFLVFCLLCAVCGVLFAVRRAWFVFCVAFT